MSSNADDIIHTRIQFYAREQQFHLHLQVIFFPHSHKGRLTPKDHRAGCNTSAASSGSNTCYAIADLAIGCRLKKRSELNVQSHDLEPRRVGAIKRIRGIQSEARTKCPSSLCRQQREAYEPLLWLPISLQTTNAQ